MIIKELVKSHNFKSHSMTYFKGDFMSDLLDYKPFENNLFAYEVEEENFILVEKIYLKMNL